MPFMATLTERLVEAEKAQHDLLTGQTVVRCRDADGSEVQYSLANRFALDAYIRQLKAEIAATPGAPSCLGPMRLIF
jgi:hypothetical protein